MLSPAGPRVNIQRAYRDEDSTVGGTWFLAQIKNKQGKNVTSSLVC